MDAPKSTVSEEEEEYVQEKSGVKEKSGGSGNQRCEKKVQRPPGTGQWGGGEGRGQQGAQSREGRLQR